MFGGRKEIFALPITRHYQKSGMLHRVRVNAYQISARLRSKVFFRGEVGKESFHRPYHKGPFKPGAMGAKVQSFQLTPSSDYSQFKFTRLRRPIYPLDQGAIP